MSGRETTQFAVAATDQNTLMDVATCLQRHEGRHRIYCRLYMGCAFGLVAATANCHSQVSLDEVR